LHLCDARAEPPAPAELAEEAREHRLLPGHGALPLAQIVAAYPEPRPIDAEIPLGQQFPELDAVQRARLIASAMRAFLLGCRPPPD
jgi:hypothetical protein